jgi:cytochrome b6-f complex iron-sulfur subunit
MTRKDFIRHLGSVTFISACSTTTLLQSCNSIKSLDLVSIDGVIRVDRTLVDVDGALIIRKFGTLPAPICVSPKDDGTGYNAVLMLCTHKKCELRASGYELNCPCHGSDFTLNGKVLSPPAQKDLQNLHVTNDNNTIFIHLQ